MANHPEAATVLPWPLELTGYYLRGFSRGLRYAPIYVPEPVGTFYRNQDQIDEFLDGELDGANFRIQGR